MHSSIWFIILTTSIVTARHRGVQLSLLICQSLIRILGFCVSALAVVDVTLIASARHRLRQMTTNDDHRETVQSRAKAINVSDFCLSIIQQQQRAQQIPS